MAWIFTFDELMWDFPYPFEERKKALLEEHHRSFNYMMTDRWGNPTNPSPGLGFETSGDCRGYAYLLDEDEEDEIIEKIKQHYGDYFTLKEGPMIINNELSEDGYYFLSNRSHPDYIGKMVPQEIIKIAKQGFGPKGTGVEWIIYLAEKFQELGVSDLAVDAVMSVMKWHGLAGNNHRTPM
jgi:cation transport protein ChaC